MRLHESDVDLTIFNLLPSLCVRRNLVRFLIGNLGKNILGIEIGPYSWEATGKLYEFSLGNYAPVVARFPISYLWQNKIHRLIFSFCFRFNYRLSYVGKLLWIDDSEGRNIRDEDTISVAKLNIGKTKGPPRSI